MTAPRRPRNFPRREWFSMSRGMRQWSIRFIKASTRIFMLGMTAPARQWFTLTTGEE